MNVTPTPTAAPTITATPTIAPTATPEATPTAMPSPSSTAAPATPTPYPWGGLNNTYQWADSSSDNLAAGLPSNLAYSITITGGTTTPVTLSWADLKSMNMVKMTASMPKHDGSVTTSEWIGIPTMNILNRAGLPSGTLSITITAPDNYGNTYTLDQLQGTMIGLKKNGTACDTNIDGGKAIQLVVPGQVGSNWVKVPTQITITAS